MFKDLVHYMFLSASDRHSTERSLNHGVSKLQILTPEVD